MTPNQHLWAQARDRLVAAVTAQGFSAEPAELMARQLGSPKAIDRMTSYVHQAHPRSEEMLVDEMLAICAEIETWRQKKESQEAQARYNSWLYYKNGTRTRRNEHEEVYTQRKTGQKGPETARRRAARHLDVFPGDEEDREQKAV